MLAISNLQIEQVPGYISAIVATTYIFCAGRPVHLSGAAFFVAVVASGSAIRA
jgi:hypothetical protein